MFFDRYSAELIEVMNQIPREDIQRLAELMDKARITGKRVFVLGNGGSAAAAAHWVCDFGKGINTPNSKRMKIMSPADCTGLFSALGNDCGYEMTFCEQIRNFLESGDLVISLSASGNSPNLLEAHRYAREIGAQTACIIGDYNGKLAELSDFVLLIGSKNYGIVEDLHIILEHSISQYLRRNNEQQELTCGG